MRYYCGGTAAHWSITDRAEEYKLSAFDIQRTVHRDIYFFFSWRYNPQWGLYFTAL